jgi:hypothetical protein
MKKNESVQNVHSVQNFFSEEDGSNITEMKIPTRNLKLFKPGLPERKLN